MSVDDNHKQNCSTTRPQKKKGTPVSLRVEKKSLVQLRSLYFYFLPFALSQISSALDLPSPPPFNTSPNSGLLRLRNQLNPNHLKMDSYWVQREREI